jgi:putrescine aminotransferase
MWFKLPEREEEELRCLKETEEYLKQGNVGGIIFNPVAWFNGFSPFSNNFWVQLRKLCNEYDSLMIVDDVMSCWGKLGSWYSYETFEGHVKPDIIAIGKSMTSGLVPIGAAMCNKKVAEKIRHMKYGHTWCPYMGAIGAINKTIEIIQRENLLDKAITIQKHNEEMCESFGDKIRSYRALGCFLAIDLHTDIPQDKYISKGLSTRYREKVIKITSPLIADQEYHIELKKKLNFILRG